MTNPRKQPQHDSSRSFSALYFACWILFFFLSASTAIGAFLYGRWVWRINSRHHLSTNNYTAWRDHLLAQQPLLPPSILDQPDSAEARALQWMVLHSNNRGGKKKDDDELFNIEIFAWIATHFHFGWEIPLAAAAASASSSICDWQQQQESSDSAQQFECDSDGHAIAWRPSQIPGLSVRNRLPTALTYLSHLRVVEAPRFGLQGTLPPTAFTLWSNLEHFDLQANAMTRVFTSADSNSNASAWQHLQYLDVSTNRLAETIPPDIQFAWSKTLRVLKVRGNFDLHGSLLEMALPHWLETLERLELGETACGGTLPSVGAASNSYYPLHTLAASYTPVHGTLPASLALPNLRVLHLGLSSSSRIQKWTPGTLPESYSSLTQLEQLSLVDLHLTGTLPAVWGQHLTALRALDVYANPGLNGTIPSEWGSGMTDLKILRLVDTRVSGTVPVELGHMTQLADLAIHRTQLSGRYDVGLFVRLFVVWECI